MLDSLSLILNPLLPLGRTLPPPPVAVQNQHQHSVCRFVYLPYVICFILAREREGERGEREREVVKESVYIDAIMRPKRESQRNTHCTNIPPQLEHLRPEESSKAGQLAYE